MMINLFQPSMGDAELEAVRKVFASNWLGKGRLTDEFESRFSSYCGVDRERIRSVGCCTEGLFQSMALLGIGSGDEVVLPTISFVGAGNAVAGSGAVPVFCDVDRRTLNPCIDDISAKVTRRTKAVLILHYGGVPCELGSICDFVESKGIHLIEDSACSVASQYRGKACGTFGDIGLWSFDAMKILVTGDGGMICCRSAELAERLERLLYLGMTSAAGFSNPTAKRWWEFDISCFGRRAIMNDIASAIGLEQLAKLPRFVARRKEVHERYDEAFADIEWLERPPPIPEHMESSYYMYWIQTRPETRDRLASYLRQREIYTSFRYYPLHRIPLYGSSAELPASEKAAASTLCLPIHQSLKDSDIDRIVEAIVDYRDR